MNRFGMSEVEFYNFVLLLNNLNIGGSAIYALMKYSYDRNSLFNNLIDTIIIIINHEPRHLY